MKAHLYIAEDSFVNNFAFSVEEIEIKIKRLAEDIRILQKFKDENLLYANFESLYPMRFHGDYTIEDFICNTQQLKKFIDRDVLNAFTKIFERAKNTTITCQEVREQLIIWNDEENCHGLIAFHQVADLDLSVQLIYGIDGWYKFRRHFLGRFPQSPSYFIEECHKYFVNLYLHQRTKDSIIAILNDFSISITKHLSFLNDVFYFYRNRRFSNESEKFRAFSIECQLEEEAAPKDNNKAKNVLTWEFIDNKMETQAITCYPHLRLCKSDKPGDGHYYYHRIYFHEGLDSIEGGNILIGHIGDHL